MRNIKKQLELFPEAIQLCNIITDSGGEIRFIGGAVRDILLNKEVTDIDLATNLNPDQVQSILESNQIRYFTIGKDFGTITAIANDQQIEITTLRNDISCDGRHAEVEFTNDWKEDAQRRDFTINALSADLQGNIYDYFNGEEDLKNNIVRFIGNPDERITEDYLRILRFFRFSAHLSEHINQEGLIASTKYATHLKNISSSRIRAELYKTIKTKNSLKILEIMHQNNILQKILPCHDYSIKYLENLIHISKDFHYQPTEIMSVYALTDRKKSKEVIQNLSLTRVEQATLKLYTSCKINDWSYESLKQYWRQYKSLFKDVVLINLSQDSSIYNATLKSNLDKLFSTIIEPLPVNGKDFIKLGKNEGAELGEIIKKAESIWYERNFDISKEDLIKQTLLP
jgi:poly(A) polymerase